MKWISFFFLASTLFLTSAFKVYKPRVIYGDDNRADLYQVEDQALARVARSTAAQISKSDLTLVGSLFHVNAKKFGDAMRLCSSEAYYSQPSGAMCSAFLVGEDLLATAGHCVSAGDCASMAYAFGYAMKSATEAPTTLPAEDVYFCKSVVARELTNSQDYAIIKLDRVVRGHDILKLAAQPVTVNSEVLVVGHPSGLPTKVAGGAQVRKQSTGFFVTNLDTYGGNSGSAVFNAETLEVVGILVRGESDFKYNSAEQCYASNKCDSNGCRGEDVTNISYVSSALNK